MTTPSTDMNTVDDDVTAIQRITRETLLAKITAQSDALIVDVTGGPRAHEVALTLVQLVAGHAAIVGSENQSGCSRARAAMSESFVADVDLVDAHSCRG